MESQDQDDRLFRQEVRRFLDDSLTSRLRNAPRTIHLLDFSMQQEWHKTLAAKGWSVPRWPTAYGGAGWTAEQCMIWDQEVAGASAPPLSPQLNMIGPVLYTFGTDEQKSRHLPPLVAGDIAWCQGYSEPGSGSDLASLRTQAVRDGDDYVLNGQKIWTTSAHHAQWMFGLVRTSTDGPRQHGITFLLIDMSLPGISVRPLITIDGLHHFNEVFFSDVRVPVTNRVGGENEGWAIAKFLLQHERSTVVGTTFLKARLAALDKLASIVPDDDGEGRAADAPGFANKLAEKQIDVLALDCLAERSRERAAAGKSDVVTTSILKLRGAEAEQDIAELVRRVLGPFGLPQQAHLLGGDEEQMVGPPGGAAAMLSYMIGRAATIAGGTSEIQKGIIFKIMRDLAASEGANLVMARYDLSDEQQLFSDAIGEFLADRYDHEARKRIIASEEGWSPEIWHAFAEELGLLGATFDEAYGGLSGDAIMQLLIMQAFGDALVVEPYLETVVIVGGFLKALGGAVAETMIPAIIAGTARCAFAYIEPHARFAPHKVAVLAEARGDEFLLSGAKSMVVGAPWATHFAVTARTSGATSDRTGISLFLIQAELPGITRRDFSTIDGQRASELTFDQVAVQRSALLGEQGAALPLIEKVLDEATAAICAEAVGIMRRLLRDTLAYLTDRRQFGSALADFQVLQHRMADMFASIELSSSLAFRAAQALSADARERGATVSAAKAYIGNAAQMVAQSAVQLHGAMGMTEEFPIGHRFKRITTILSQFGSTDYHLSRFTRLGGPELLFGTDIG